ncbi:MAG: hypothetical protein HY291_06120 [Planctomycetes bacterium]|nr:hypothetical protein [Planctomycetota bacterium]
MGYALIWIESLAAALLLVALAAALWTHLTPGKRVLAFGAASALVAALVAALVCAFFSYSDAIPVAVSLLVLEFGAFFIWIRRKGWERPAGFAGVAGTLLVAALPLAPASHISIMAGMLKFRSELLHSWFGYALSWTLLYLVGSAWILRAAWRRREGEARASAGWPRERLALAAAAALMVSAMTFWNLDLGVRTRLNDMRTEAGAMALAIAPPRLPEQENAALVYTQAFEAEPESSRWPQEWKTKHTRWIWGHDEKMVPMDMGANDTALTAFLAAHEQSLKLLRRAERLPDCEFDRDWSQGFSMVLWDLVKMRNSARLLGIHARREAALGHLKTAFDDIGVIFGIARHVRRDPILICILVASAVDSIGLGVLAELVERTHPSLDDLRGLELDDVVSYKRQFQRCLQMEEAMGIASFATIAQGDTLSLMQQIGWNSGRDARLPLSELYSPLIRLFLLQDDLESFRDVMHQARALAGRPYHEINSAWKDLFPSSDTLALRMRGLVTWELTSVLGHTYDAFVYGDARYRMARTVVAMARYRAEHGRLPAKLEDLTPAYLPIPPADPFDGKPLRLVSNARGVTLYSVGPEGKDNGGEPWEELFKEFQGVRFTPAAAGNAP